MRELVTLASTVDSLKALFSFPYSVGRELTRAYLAPVSELSGIFGTRTLGGVDFHPGASDFDLALVMKSLPVEAEPQVLDRLRRQLAVPFAVFPFFDLWGVVTVADLKDLARWGKPRLQEDLPKWRCLGGNPLPALPAYEPRASKFRLDAAGDCLWNYRQLLKAMAGEKRSRVNSRSHEKFVADAVYFSSCAAKGRLLPRTSRADSLATLEDSFASLLKDHRQKRFAPYSAESQAVCLHALITRLHGDAVKESWESCLSEVAFTPASDFSPELGEAEAFRFDDGKDFILVVRDEAWPSITPKTIQRLLTAPRPPPLILTESLFLLFQYPLFATVGRLSDSSPLLLQTPKGERAFKLVSNALVKARLLTRFAGMGRALRAKYLEAASAPLAHLVFDQFPLLMAYLDEENESPSLAQKRNLSKAETLVAGLQFLETSRARLSLGAFSRAWEK